MSSCLDSTVHATSTSSKQHIDPNFVEVTISTPAAAAVHPISDSTDHARRGQWVRAAILGANDGLVSVASLMIGVGAVSQNSRAMLVSGLAGLVAGACSMAIGEFVSVYAQYDIELAELKRHNCQAVIGERLPSPTKAAAASAISFAVGALLPLLAGGFIALWWVRLVVVSLVSSVGLVAFGAMGAVLGGAASVVKAAGRVLIGGWISMLVTYAVLRLLGLAFNLNVSNVA
ncbi:hypothetical protein HPP92_021025 [Vanilla planifolia]|uniref:Vacuolar iron transporter n=1 Tax=Vanilla planifolia TaxID=51239 RepID=A0A835Q153_VANPL|nr:hypothetical protein HPP92_021025 [Vanilla planifolia]